jgi:deazaflavin-dependent oxidoreductase (nitroreductase family)
MPIPPPSPKPGTPKARFVNRIIGLNTLAYRLSGGRLGGRTGGGPVLLLEHRGRRSGTLRTVPLVYTRVGDDLVVLASAAGADHHPAWWLNLKADPRTTVTIGRERHPVVARETAGEERARLWAEAVEVYPGYEVYRERTTREMPVIVLSPDGSPPPRG